ncbi:MAG TPA: sugar transferase [Anaeromyxobacteraceae bacterium]|nr:sugar transferase [Anaeromyxobacteraceae bacterium]
MIHRLGHLRGPLLRLLDLGALCASLPIALFVYRRMPHAEPFWTPPAGTYALALAAALLIWSVAAWSRQLYTEPLREIALEVRRALQALLLTGMTFVTFAFAAKVTGLSRLVMGVYFVAAAALLVLNRVGSLYVAREARRRGFRLRYYAVVGCGDLAREIVSTISARREWGLKLAGFITDDERPTFADCVILGRLDDLGRILEEHVLDEVIFAVPRARLPAIESAILLCEEQGIAARISLDILRYGRSKMSLTDVDGLPMLAFTRTPSDAIALALKRVFDVATSAGVLLLTSPILCAVAIAIKLDSPGPVFFRQRRVGLNGRRFTMFKFRSMRADAEARLESLRARNEMNGPVFKIKDDPRITRVGRLIRRTSLDEFPQFWNVLIGDMSVVGPRPPLPTEVAMYARWQRRRLSVRPGITCTWQISGRNDIDFERWMELDLEYIDGWSLASDVWICLKTIPAVLSARGAH